MLHVSSIGLINYALSSDDCEMVRMQADMNEYACGEIQTKIVPHVKIC